MNRSALIDRIPDADRLYLLKWKRVDLPPVDVNHAHEKLSKQGFSLAAKTMLLNEGRGALWLTFESDRIARMDCVLYAWVVDDTIVRIGKSKGIFCDRFVTRTSYARNKAGSEKFVTAGIESWPNHYRKDKGDSPEEIQLWVTLFRRAGGHGSIYAKSSEFNRSKCPEESDLLERHRPALNRSLT
jgi:hypothetical protein